MASFFYTRGMQALTTGGIDMDSDTLKLMLVKSSYTATKADVSVAYGVSSNPNTEELSVSGYTGGFAGSGRKTVTITQQVNDGANRVEFAIDDQTWTSLAAGQTIGGAILYKHLTNDTSSTLIAFFDLTDTPTNGGNITLDFATLAAGGNMQITV